MTEAEWLACDDPEQMRVYLRGKKVATDRKLRLYGCACCRLVWQLIPTGCGRDAVGLCNAFVKNRPNTLRAGRSSS
jgi:hypothetical protein